jgi:hypothetical protein
MRTGSLTTSLSSWGTSSRRTVFPGMGKLDFHGTRCKHSNGYFSLERQSSSRTQHRSRAKEPSSPWFGTLNKTEPSTPVYHGALQPQQQLHLQQVQRSKSMMAAVPTIPPPSNGYYSDDSEDDEDDRWADSAPVVPLKPMLDAMGFIPSPAPKDHIPLHGNGYGQHSPVIPYGMPYPHTPQHYSMSVAGSPMHAPSRQLSARHSTYSSQSANGGSPYVPAWMALPPSSAHGGSNGGSPAGSHPPSRAPSSAGGYGMPYMPSAY